MIHFKFPIKTKILSDLYVFNKLKKYHLPRAKVKLMTSRFHKFVYAVLPAKCNKKETSSLKG